MQWSAAGGGHGGSDVQRRAGDQGRVTGTAGECVNSAFRHSTMQEHTRMAKVGRTAAIGFRSSGKQV